MLNRRFIALYTVNCRSFALEVVFCASLKDFEFAVNGDSLPQVS